MANFEIDPISYFIKSTNYNPSEVQKSIIDTMDSCKFTIIPEERAFGISTALKAYTEWEFLYSNDPIDITFVVNNHHEINNTFYNRLDRYRKRKESYVYNHNTLEVQGLEHFLNVNNMRGSKPSDVYVIDSCYNKSNIHEEALIELLSICEYQKGMKYNKGLSYDYKNIGYSLNDYYEKYTVNVYQGSRFVIITSTPLELINILLNAGVDEDEIGMINMSGKSFYDQHSKNEFNNFCKQFAVQNMTSHTGPTFKWRYSP